MPVSPSFQTFLVDYQLPEDLLEDVEALRPWAEKALAAAAPRPKRVNRKS